MSKVKVALVDDHQIVLAGLKKLLEDEYEVVCTARNFREALENIPSSGAELVLIDVHLPGKSGVELLQALKEKMPSALFIMLTVEEDEEIIFRAIREGARGYILKHNPPEVLLKSLKACMNGEVLWGEEIYLKVMGKLRRGVPFEVDKADLSALADLLSGREFEIVQLVIQGLGNREIAEKLFISENTVKNHLSRIFQKLGVKDRVELALLVTKISSQRESS
ncbi:MAG: response regulator transcription factor [Candidatus Atribacteria bacterium]|nr:response regulator transcription factor [Candidatus Atribacteria bacterium]